MGSSGCSLFSPRRETAHPTAPKARNRAMWEYGS